MQTYSHFLMTLVANQILKRRQSANTWLPPLRSQALLLGSVIPDVPLTLIAFTTISIDLIQGNFQSVENSQVISDSVPFTQLLFQQWFFESVWVKTAHNLFHAPIPIACYVVIGWLAWKQQWSGFSRWGPTLFWMGCACWMHTLIDIPCHHDDGPLLLFPFNLDLRYRSPVSYWDPNHYGQPFTIFEHLLVAGMIAWVVLNWRKKQGT